MEKELHNLLVRIQKKDTLALDELLIVAGRRLYAVAYCILRNPDDADDAFQEAMLRLVNNISKYKYKNPYSYIASIVRNASIDIYNEKRNGYTISMETIPDISVPDFSGETLERHVLAQAMKGLSPTQRKIIYLYYFNDLTVREIARELSIPKSTVQGHLQKACGAMKERAEE